MRAWAVNSTALTAIRRPLTVIRHQSDSLTARVEVSCYRLGHHELEHVGYSLPQSHT